MAMATPQGGNHHDLYEIRSLFEQMCRLPEDAAIRVKGIFLNADAGFDAEELRTLCSEKQIAVNIADNPRNGGTLSATYQHFEEQLYKERFVIERTNAWLDSFKTLLVRFEKNINSWMAQHFMAFAVLLLRKVKTC